MRPDPFYNSRAWKRLRAAKLAQDPMCELCHRAAASEVDHKISISAGGDPLAWDNIQSACHECHSRKTYYIERLGRNEVPVKGVDPKTGLPIDPKHWWNQKKTCHS